MGRQVFPQVNPVDPRHGRPDLAQWVGWIVAFVCAILIGIMLAVQAYAGENPPLPHREGIPNAHVLVHYYCPDCSASEKAHVAEVASVINYQDPNCYARLAPYLPAPPPVGMRYRLIQYVQFMTLYGDPNQTGEEDLEDLEEFARANGYDVEEFFLHWSEPTRQEREGASVEYDGRRTVLTDKDGERHVLDTSRAMAIVWGDFYYLFDLFAPEWIEWIADRTRRELRPFGNSEQFDGLFEDVLCGQWTDTTDGTTLGGGIWEWGGLRRSEVDSSGLYSYLVRRAQETLDRSLPGALFLPNAGNYTQAWSVATMLAGDGAFSEGMCGPGGTLWREWWETARVLSAARRYYSIGCPFGDVPPADYPAGSYRSGEERRDLQHFSLYLMGYEPGYVLIDVNRACCDWSAAWPDVLSADVGAPVGAPHLADSGRTPGGWAWELWARSYSGGRTVYYRGNMAWRSGNGSSPGLGEATRATFDLSAGSLVLRSDGEWAGDTSRVSTFDGWGMVTDGRLTGEPTPGDDDGGGDDDAEPPGWECGG